MEIFLPGQVISLIADRLHCLMRTIYASDDSLKFFYKVSSEPNYDFLSFRLNEEEIFKKSGEIPWTRKAVAVKTGLNKMEWTYKKDNTVSQGSDCAWIDMIDFAQSGPVSYIQKDLQVARIVTPARNESLWSGRYHGKSSEPRERYFKWLLIWHMK